MLTLDVLKLILDEVAGADDDTAFDGDVLDVAFVDLGYDSLALLEAASRVNLRFGVRLSDEAVAGLQTPREFLNSVNETLLQAV
ncbi:acyl carrier protein [Streptacidiphilus jiangxiensis]|uniref:Act minimal PKS acyl carrier protein n=1 Tax=Streptacidiphilus jiangxiensis TaxID=235985 RepID=A0A1H7JMB5_STRJI|nr:acyl carrier protein [Streptacidiphilus jiangxiensis]SEK75701.1 act minimal PKS acyl carrier protein [Streptacidiphilus jiangxiensis]